MAGWEWSGKIKICKTCKRQVENSEGHQSLYCPFCNEWVESKCDWKRCEFCVNRPEKPLQ